MVEDVNTSIDFYLNVLGFDFVMSVPENSQDILTAWKNGQTSLDFAMMKCGNAEIMFQSRKCFAEELPECNDLKIGGSLTLYIEVDNLQELYDKIKDKVSVIKKMEIKFYGMKEFHIRDSNGYILGFAQRINGQG